MKSWKIFFALLSVTVVSCDGGGAIKQAGGNCTLELAASPDGTPVLGGNCTRDAANISAAIARAHGILTSGGEIALGRIPFDPAGAFDRCGIMAHLAGDPRWSASIDSNKAGVPLRDALQTETLAPSVSNALAKAGRKLRGVSVETVLLSDGPAKDCQKSPVKAPIEAQIWLSLE